MLGTLLGALGGAPRRPRAPDRELLAVHLGNLLVGSYQGFAQFYRFAAAEVASAEFKSRAISFVLGGRRHRGHRRPPSRQPHPRSSRLGRHLRRVLRDRRLPQPRRDGAPRPSAGPATCRRPRTSAGARPLAEIVRQPAFVVALTGAAVGYGVMILAMTATPLAMVAHHHDVGDAAFVIQWHVLGMFVPSFFTGTLIARFGVLPVMFIGAVLLLGHVTIALSGVALLNFVSALVLLGVGWNFLFIGGTTLLTETYRPSEKGKVQGLNDFLIVGVVVIASFASGGLLQRFGWQGVNVAALPFLLASPR